MDSNELARLFVAIRQGIDMVPALEPGGFITETSADILGCALVYYYGDFQAANEIRAYYSDDLDFSAHIAKIFPAANYEIVKGDTVGLWIQTATDEALRDLRAEKLPFEFIYLNLETMENAIQEELGFEPRRFSRFVR